jgi:hypothetical protein
VPKHTDRVERIGQARIVTPKAHGRAAYAAMQYLANPAIVLLFNEKAFKTVSEIWKTKYGSRRVKQALPTIEEALAAAECLSEDFEQQIEIAASLLGVEAEEVRSVAKRPAPPKPNERRLSLPIGQSRASAAPRSVVVEYRAPKRLVGVR